MKSSMPELHKKKFHIVSLQKHTTASAKQSTSSVLSNQISNDRDIQSKNDDTIDFRVEMNSRDKNNQIDEDQAEKQSGVSQGIDNICELEGTEENYANEDIDELENQCDCCECRIRRNSNYSTEQLPIDTQLPMALMSESLMFCTIL